MFYLSEELDEAPVLPELLELLGRELTCRFLKAFAGRTIKLPSVARVKAAVSAVGAFQRVEQSRRRMGTEKAIGRVAIEMKTSNEMTRARYKNVLRLARYADGVLGAMSETSWRDE